MKRLDILLYSRAGLRGHIGHQGSAIPGLIRLDDSVISLIASNIEAFVPERCWWAFALAIVILLSILRGLVRIRTNTFANRGHLSRSDPGTGWTSSDLSPDRPTLMFASARPMGHFGGAQMKMATMTLGTVQMELQRHKRMPMMSTEAYLGCLNRSVHPGFSIHAFPPLPCGDVEWHLTDAWYGTGCWNLLL